MSETPQNDEHTASEETKRASTSRRRVLQAAAAAGALPGLAQFEGVRAQETTTEGEGDDGRFFQEGTEVGVQQVAGGMTAPTDFSQPDGDDRYFVSDQTGQVWIIDPDDGRQDEPFVDVSDRMVELGQFNGDYAEQGQDYDERGLLGLTFHPDFQDNGRFYLHYSAPRTDDMPDNWDHREHVSEFQANDDGTSGDPDSEQVLLDIPHPQYNHDAGPIAFGPDGYLYVPMGDGGGANDSMYGHVDDWYDGNEGGNGQDVTENLLGDILRIDVDGGDGAEGTTTEGGETATAAEGETTTAGGEGGRPYGIPEDNPFAGDDAEGREEIYAWGFRNPFGISFDSDGRLFVPDVGQDVYEEANIVENGGNYGWNVKEGTHCFSTESPSQAPDQCPNGTPDDVRGGEPFQEPIVEYPHTYQGNVVGITIIGGHFYEQDTVSGLQGKYVFGDWTQDPSRGEPAGRLFAAAEPESGDATVTATGAEGGETTTAEGTTAADGDEQVVPRDRLWEMEELVVTGEFDWFVRQFGQNDEGEIFVLAGKEGIPQGDSGALLQIVPPEEGEGGAETATETSAAGAEETEATTEEAQETEPGETTEGQEGELTTEDETTTEDEE